MSQEKIQRRSVLGGAAALGATAGLAAVPGVTAAAPAPSAAPGAGKVVLITGSSSGFGNLTALTLARAGHRVYASMRDTTRANAAPARTLRDVARRERLALEVVDIDVRDDRSVEDGVRRVRQRAGRIDVLINNAGMFHPAVLETQTIADLRGIFDTNLYGHLRMNRVVLPTMRAQRDGLIIQVTTALGRFVFPFLGAYCGAKWALEAMTETTRYEVSQLGIDVVIIEPGAYSTDFVDPNGVDNYRQYLRHLSPDNTRRRSQYGELARRAESHLIEDSPADPQEIADTITTILRTPRGQRPVRVLGPGVDDFIGELHEAATRVQAGIMAASGFGDLTTVKPT